MHTFGQTDGVCVLAAWMKEQGKDGSKILFPSKQWVIQKTAF
jgi:hypothetical protein